MNNRTLSILYTGDTHGIKNIDVTIKKFFASSERHFVNGGKELNNAVKLSLPNVIVAAFTEKDFSTFDLINHLSREAIRIPVLLVAVAEFEDAALVLLDQGGIDDYLTYEYIRRLPYAIKNLAANYRLKQQDDQRYRYLFDQNLAGLYTSSVKGEVLECNTAFANMLGYASPAELIGKQAVDLYLIASDRNSFLKDLRKHKKLYNYESVLVRKDGSPGYLLENIYLTSDSLTGEEICQGVMIDVTQLVITKKNIIRARTMLTEAQNLARMGNWNYNMRKQELTVSVGLKEICGVPRDTQFSVEEFIALVHEEDFDRVLMDFKSLEVNGGKIENNFTVIHKDKGNIKVNAVHTLDFDEEGKVLRYYGVVQDVTALEMAELERDRITEELIKRNKALEQFTYVISHNLRAPVANIRALAEILEESATGQGNKDLLEKMNLSVLNLDAIITDLNQILQIKQQQHSNKEQVNLHALMASIHLSIKNLITQENVTIRLDVNESCTVTAVKSYLYSVFYNLTLNSIKYRKMETDPVIRISCSEEDKELIIAFEDNSKGIDLEKNGNELFGLYKRFDSSVEGKGMGLYMVKAQVEELGGTIAVDSTLGLGTRFIIRLPHQSN